MTLVVTLFLVSGLVLPTGSVAATGSISAVASVSMSGGQAAATSSPGSFRNGMRREVMGFLPYWSLDPTTTASLAWTTLTTVAYFGVEATGAGQLKSSGPGYAGWRSGALSRVIAAAHAHGARVVLTVQRFAWTTGDTAISRALLESPEARDSLVTSVVAAVKARRIDGVNLDFEPIPSGDAAAFHLLVAALRSALTTAVPHSELTYDATAVPDSYDVATLTSPGYADAVLVMAYDYIGPDAPAAGSVAPLNGPAFNVLDTIDLYLAAGVPGSAIILGEPYYGRAWSTVDASPGAATRRQGATYGPSTAPPYAAAVATAAAHGRRWDGITESPWTAYSSRACSSCPMTTRELYYDDPTSLGLKDELVNRDGLRGVGLWALGYDNGHPELTAAAHAAFGPRDTTPPVATLAPLPPVSPGQGIAVSWSGRDIGAGRSTGTGIASYDLDTSTDGGPWTPWLRRLHATTAMDMAAAGRTVAFRVRATDGAGNVGPWSTTIVALTAPTVIAPATFVRTTTSMYLRSSPSLVGDMLEDLPAGSLLAVRSGPVDADGSVWWQVDGPLMGEPTDPLSARQGAWVSEGDSLGAYLIVVPAPDTTTVQGRLPGSILGWDGTASLGTWRDR
ncbi:MAG: glycosyl hydrolase family 18 protein [Candidatus Limnocylindrales bacterium]